MATEHELGLSDYLSILKRRWLQMVIAAGLILLASIILAIFLPPVYQSVGTILVESQHIPDDVVKANVTTYADERIEVIKQRVMTRDNLYRIMQKYNLYPKKVDSETTSTLIDKMRKSISVELLNADVNNSGGPKATIAFKLGFEYENPEITHKVANEIVTLFLDENVKARTERATETTEFLTQEVETLRKELESVENKVAAYKQQYSDALPEHMDMHMNMLERAELDMKEVDREAKSTQEELRYLDVQLASSKAAVKRGDTSSDSQGNPISNLDKAKAELDRALILYKETHPTIRALKRKIENLEKETEAPVQKKSTKTDIEAELVVAKVQAEIEAAKVRLNSYEQQKKSMREKMAQLQAQVTKSPQVEKGLFSLMRDYENAKSKYEEVKSKQINAKIAGNLEQENKAERFSMLEPPIFPDKPIKPDRKKIIAVGILGALVGSLGLVALLESLDGRLRGVEAMSAVINMRPLVIVPYITTQAELKRKRHLTRYWILALIAVLLLALLLVHLLVAPLDLLIAKIMARFV